ncbi:M20/M25/M40 family metallo-hydrolase [Altericroceibacterium endophyticum]|uniref:M20/M25/M40 family metallo-hydrolase n=1 Tax=Altericroceibacterium endophyticum TaxID=1808508 RepID=A0A6I4T4G4_9SPHN|nr:M20/M25/M40 family metallo-hydrolase [Altericroceibacterium endophyticum]MXO64953.1 M20/M25/M40 family metallo-hydrolase [Altericroceibacterium endophyticum]
MTGSFFRASVAACALAFSFAGAAPAFAAEGNDTAWHATDQDRADALELLKELIAIPTYEGSGNMPQLIDVLQKRLVAAGFPEDAITRVAVPNGELTPTGLIVRYQGRNPEEQPVAFLAHMDVVGAVPANWETDPYEPVIKDGYLYGRGSQDNKFGVALLVSTFARLKREGWTPERDLLLAFAGDEETGMTTTRAIIANPLVSRAKFALNSDAGGGEIKADGTPVAFGMQAAEKTYATFFVSASNPGGHSSVPREDNAIYDLAHALIGIQALHFPVEFNDITRAMIEKSAQNSDEELSAALTTLLADPDNAEAQAVARRYPTVSKALWTTCVATMLDAGNAENALPQNATATVNCRIMPATSVESVRQKLVEAVGNPAVSVELGDEIPVESPVSPLRDDVFGPLQNALNVTYPGSKLEPVMSSGGTEGREYRSAGIPTYGAGSLGAVMPDDARAHGIDERIRVESYYKELDYWDHLIREIGE